MEKRKKKEKEGEQSELLVKKKKKKNKGKKNISCREAIRTNGRPFYRFGAVSIQEKVNRILFFCSPPFSNSFADDNQGPSQREREAKRLFTDTIDNSCIHYAFCNLILCDGCIVRLLYLYTL